MRNLFIIIFSLFITTVSAQIGEYRNEFAVGFNGGLNMSSVDFVPEVPQSQLFGKTFGLSLRYTGEKYFNSICAIVAEVNYSQMGWEERIWDANDEPVINATTGQAESYQRDMTYLQVPVLARMGWGRERRGVQFFVQAGPQVGFFLSEKTQMNFP